ncbi:MAG: ROK family protein [Thermoleophilia bacterium]
MLGVDIGGTKIGLGLVDSGGTLHGPPIRVSSDTRDSEGLVRGLVAAVRNAVEAACCAGFEVGGVGLGCAGTVDRARGAIVISPNLPLVDVPLARLVSEQVGLPVALDNDANVAALAEARVGAAVGLRNVAMLTLGTGVGGGLILDGRLYRGATGAAAELGHTIVAAGGERCRCGALGCLEAYASGKALERTASRLIDSDGRLPALGEVGAGAVSGWAATPWARDPGVQGGEGVAAAHGPRAAGLPAVYDMPLESARVSVAGLAELRDAGRLDGESIGRLALAGDPGALAAVTEVGAWLGVGVVNLANVFEPEAVVVGGGLGALGELLLGPARRVLRAGALAPNRDTRLLAAAVGAEAGVVGAGLLAWEELQG